MRPDLRERLPVRDHSSPWLIARNRTRWPGNLQAQRYAGRRVLVSRKWSGKTLADHRGDRKQWLMDMLGLSATEPAGRYRWDQVTPNDTDYLPPPKWLIQVVA